MYIIDTQLFLLIKLKGKCLFRKREEWSKKLNAKEKPKKQITHILTRIELDNDDEFGAGTSHLS